MVRVPVERLRPLIAELNALRSRFAAANQYASKLTVEHNRLVAETDQMPAGIARAKRQEHAEQLLRRKIAAYSDEKRLQSAIGTKEEEIADLIKAMWAAATALNDPELSRRLQAAFTGLSDRVVKIEERLEKLDDEVTGLRHATTRLVHDGEQVRETVVGLRANMAQMSAVLSGVRGDIADARSFVGTKIGDLAGPVGPLQSTVVKHGWEPGLRPPTEPRSPAITPDTLAELPPKITALLFATQSGPDKPVDIGEEIRDIQNRINDAAFSDTLHLQAWLATRPHDIMPGLNRHQPTIVHFSGHGEPGALLLSGDFGNTEYLPVDVLLKIFRSSADHLRMAFLNVCDSEEDAAAAARVLDVAIGMHGRIPDTMARMFAARFYSSLAFGESVKKAFEQGLIEVDEFPEARTGPQLFHRRTIDPHEIVFVQPRRTS